MTLAVSRRGGSVALDEPATDDRGPTSSTYQMRFELIVRIAVFVLRPLDYIDDAHCNIPPLEGKFVRAMAQQGSFMAPLNRAMAEATGVAALKFDDGIIFRLMSSSQSRLAALIATAPMNEVSVIASMIAASALWKRISQIILKVDRDRVREILGPDGFRSATREAPMLNRALGDLGWSSVSSEIFRHDTDRAKGREALQLFGLNIVRGFLEAVEPLLSDLFALRLPHEAGSDDPGQAIVSLDDAYCVQVVRLVRRKKTAWSHIIG